METGKYKTLGELEDKFFGEIGTPERAQYEFELSMEILGARLKQIRKDKNMTQAELGEKLGGISKQNISHMERDVKPISKKIAKQLADIFNVSVEKFI